MIDIIKAEKSFKEYLQDYDLNNGAILLKVKHTYEVAKLSDYIAKEIGLDEENIKLAKLIGILHDIGRFEQLKQTSTFLDSNEFDHANFGAKILFKDNLIRKFIEDSQYDNLIEKAIVNHNKYKIEEGLDKLTNLHCKIIRDADKIDNFRVKETERMENIFPGQTNIETMKYETISDKVFEDFQKHQLIKLEDRKTQLDFWVCVLAFIFDLNFKASYKYVKDKNYVNVLIERLKIKNKETKQRMEIIRKCGNEFVEENSSNL